MNNNVIIEFVDKVLNPYYDNIIILKENLNILYVKNSQKEKIDPKNLSIEQKQELQNFLKKIDFSKLKKEKIYEFQEKKEGIVCKRKIVSLCFDNVYYYIILIKIENNSNNNLNLYDSLTGIYNRQGLSLVFDIIKNYENLEIIIIDIYNFRLINKLRGFKYGDKLLVELTKDLLKTFSNKNMTIARVAIDIFVLILPKNNDNISLLLEVLRKYNKNNIFFNIGIISELKNISNKSFSYNNFFEKIMHKLEITLEHAKMNKKQIYSNSIEYYNDILFEKIIKKLETKTMVENAIKNKSFLYYYQPIVDKNGKIVSIETLLRLKNVYGKIISPGLFIEYLEESKLIKEVDLLLTNDLKKTLKYIKDNNINIDVSLNLSAATLEDVKKTKEILDNYMKYKELLKIEITERLLIMRNVLEQTILNKFKIIIDDFGTGYSSLKYLAEIKIDYLKLDISFVREMFNPNTKNYYLIIKTIINFAKDLKLKVVAEGVETKEQFEELKKLGCDYFQGYYFYKPMPFEELKEILEKKGIK